jgi:hypothetical protein
MLRHPRGEGTPVCKRRKETKRALPAQKAKVSSYNILYQAESGMTRDKESDVRKLRGIYKSGV